ncbi:hypothetical protein M1466_00240 [Candidatus Dependentiae bacterium]|nr:hypothetical protein [Candidatus Dependentiae bacterium]
MITIRLIIAVLFIPFFIAAMNEASSSAAMTTASDDLEQALPRFGCSRAPIQLAKSGTETARHISEMPTTSNAAIICEGCSTQLGIVDIEHNQVSIIVNDVTVRVCTKGHWTFVCPNCSKKSGTPRCRSKPTTLNSFPATSRQCLCLAACLAPATSCVETSFYLRDHVNAPIASNVHAFPVVRQDGSPFVVHVPATEEYSCLQQLCSLSALCGTPLIKAEHDEEVAVQYQQEQSHTPQEIAAWIAEKPCCQRISPCYPSGDGNCIFNGDNCARVIACSVDGKILCFTCFLMQDVPIIGFSGICCMLFLLPRIPALIATQCSLPTRNPSEEQQECQQCSAALLPPWALTNICREMVCQPPAPVRTQLQQALARLPAAIRPACMQK